MKIRISDLVWYLIGVLIGSISGILSEGYLRKHRYLYIAASMLLILTGLSFLSGCSKDKELVDVEEDTVQAAEILSESENNISVESRELSNSEDSSADLPGSKQPEQDAVDEIQDPISDFITQLSDVYAEKDSFVVFKCYYPEATKYAWEVYEEGRWSTVAENEIIPKVDELYRKTSTYMTSADKEKRIRCRISLVNEMSILEEAGLYILPQEISSVSADTYIAMAGQYVDSLDIPVMVTFSDGSKEVITGLNGLCFWNTKEKSIEQSTTESGGIQETVTMVSMASEYTYAAAGENEGRMRYQDQEISIMIKGEDRTAPEIQDLTVSEFQVSDGSSKSEPITVTFQAEDDISLRSTLEYAFLPAGAEPQETDWSSKASFDVDITRNGTWVAYCRDESGNIASKEKEMIVIDSEPPVVKLHLENESWCQENKIIVEAEDDSAVQYCYNCISQGVDSGWISESIYMVKENGTWKVQVKDEAGNLTEEEISISNIDTEPPIVRGIVVKEKSGGEAKIDEE